MSEVEEAVFVEKMAEEAEAVPFHGEDIGVGDLYDFTDNTQDNQTEIQPVSSTTEQLVDFLQSDAQEAEKDQVKEDIPSSTSPQQDETVEPDQVTSSAMEAPVSEPEQTNEDVVQPLQTDKELTSCMAKWLTKNNVDQRVIDLIYWKCWKKTAAIFGAKLFILWSLTCCTFLSVMTFLSMCVLAVAFLYRIGMTVFNAVQKTTSEHPFRHLLDEDLDFSEESVQKWANEARIFINARVKSLKKLFLIEDVVESLKFGVVLWLLSYVGSCLSLITIAILTCLYVFTVPVLYERHQEQVDSCLATVKNKVKDLFSKVQDKLPEKLKFGKVKDE